MYHLKDLRKFYNQANCYRLENSLPVCEDLDTPCPLQTIYGELISLESNNDTLGLAMFVLQRLLWNPDIAAVFRHAKVPHLYKDGRQNAKYYTKLCDELKRIVTEL